MSRPLLDQRVSKQKIVALRKHQRTADQRVAAVVGSVDEPSQQAKIESLADDGGRLKGLPVARRQAVHARQNEALDRGWDHILAAFFGIAQQLLEEERIAGGALDTRQRQALAGVDESPRESQGFRRPQRAKIDRGEGDAAASSAPGGVDRIAFDARGHHQDARALGHSRGDRSEMPENLRIGPVQILYDYQVGPLRQALPATVRLPRVREALSIASYSAGHSPV